MNKIGALSQKQMNNEKYVILISDKEYIKNYIQQLGWAWYQINQRRIQWNRNYSESQEDAAVHLIYVL